MRSNLRGGKREAREERLPQPTPTSAPATRSCVRRLRVSALLFLFLYLFGCVLLWNTIHYPSSGRLSLNNSRWASWVAGPAATQTPAFTTKTRQAFVFHDQFNDNTTTTYNDLLYVGKFGLGHRFSKMVSAYHLATTTPELCALLDRFVVDWGSCDGGENAPEIFQYLFGSNTLALPCPKNVSGRRNNIAKTVILRNDVRGYFAAQSYKNARIPVSREALQAGNPHAWNRKMDFDQLFFRHLLDAFWAHRHGRAARDFLRLHQWEDHFVVGLHLRAGNGEQDHFVEADRGVSNLTEWCHNVIHTLRCMLHDGNNNKTASTRQKSPLLFLSTDTAALVPVIEKAMVDIPVIVFPQERLPSQEGVSYQKWTQGELCYAGWRSSMTDMALLASTDLLVAATRSTFTQILPLSQVFSTNKRRATTRHYSSARSSLYDNNDTTAYKFCEVGNAGRTMTCFRNRNAWFLRQDGEKTWQFLNGRCQSWIPPPLATSTVEAEFENKTAARIVHKVMVHLPDVEQDPLLQDAITFLADAKSTESRYYYGAAFSRKYRGGLNSVFRSDWTFFD